MLTCATCGNEEPEGSRFCGSCGAPFAPVQPHAAATAAVASSASTLTCASCGNEEPEGSRFCGSCGALFELEEQPLAGTEATRPLVDQPPRDESRPPASPAAGRRRLRWVAAGAAAVLLVAAGATAAVLSFTGDDANEATPTDEQLLPSTSSETEPLETGATLADAIGPPLEEVAAAQAAVDVRVRSPIADTVSFAALRQAGAALAASVTRAQGLVDALVANGSTEASTFSLLRLALSSHLAYANTISALPAGPPAFARAQAEVAIAQAGEAGRAYVALADADPALPIVSINSADHSALLAAVPAPTPTPTPPAVAPRAIDLAPLLVGIGPDDPPGEGRCFGRYSSRATLRVSGVVHGNGFIQCGDDAQGAPGRTSGIYRFSGRTFPAGSKLARITAQAAIDESSSSSQRGTRVTWTVFYGGAPICSTTVVWSGSRPSPRKLDCKVPTSASSTGFDLQRLRIQQVAFPASSGDLWAGLLNPTIVVTSP